MLRLTLVALCVAAAANGSVVRRQADAAAASSGCPFTLLPVLNVCPPCQPSGCFCADGRELNLEDQRVAEEVSHNNLSLF
jgi:hypothetical protein